MIGLIPADPETWKVRRKAIVPGFHKAWLNAMVGILIILINNNIIMIDNLFRFKRLFLKNYQFFFVVFYRWHYLWIAINL